jgi:polysaccharide pyruvyl transferase WcaK-like protein
VRLLHLANHGGTNIGNGALICGLERVLAEDLAGPPAFVPEPWDEYGIRLRRFDESFVARVNADADALLVGAAVSFDGRRIYPHTGMRFDLPLALWAKLERPIVFYGLSHRTWPWKPYDHADALRRFAEHVAASDRVLFSVRNDGTKEWLEAMTGVASDRIHEVPDPAVFVPVEDAPHPELREGRTNVVVSLNAEDPQYRFGEPPGHGGQGVPARARRGLRRLRGVPEQWERRRNAFLTGLAGALVRLADELDVNVILASHDVEDMRMGYELVRRTPDPFRQRIVFASTCLPPSRAPYFYDLYAKADVAISMRIHSMNPAIGLGTPVVPIVSQQRMATFMRDAGLEELCVPLSRPQDTVGAVLRALADRDRVTTVLTRARDTLRERVRTFDRLVEEHLRS